MGQRSARRRAGGSPRAWRMLRTALILGGLAILAGGCSGDDAADEATVTVGMVDNQFTRDVTRVPVGGEVVFENQGETVHNAVALDADWSTQSAVGDLAMEAGESARLGFDEPGVYDFVCTFHATEDGEGMAGTLVVGDVDYQADDDAPTQPVTEGTGVTRRVPQDHPTIQNAVDASEPGDLVLVEPAPRDAAHRAEDGAYVYPEQVDVTVPYLTIRGTDRNEVIVDGEHQRPHAINVVAADGVTVENLTARNAAVNGVFFNNLTGFRARYLTATNNGVYGIYAFDATDGAITDSIASGSQDGAFYVGQCRPCEVVIDEVIGQRSGVGYTGTNASGVHLIDSVWRDNVGGIVPNTLDTELLPPVEDVVIMGNLVHDNGNRDAPALPLNYPTFGNGITIAGGLDATIERNRIVNHARNGIIVTPNLSRNFWMSGGNTVRDNVIEGTGYSSLTLSGPSLPGNCFSGNTAGRTIPPGLESLHGCDGGLRLPLGFELASTLSSIGLVAEAELGLAHDVDYRQVAPPADQPSMPEARDAPVEPAVDVFASYELDLDAIEVPPRPDGLEVDGTVAPSLVGVPLTGGWLLSYFAVAGWLLPFGVLAGLLALVLIDLARREDLGPARTAAWTGGAVIVPIVGPLLYLLGGRPIVGRRIRIGAVVIGLVGSLTLLAVGMVAGGVV